MVRIIMLKVKRNYRAPIRGKIFHLYRGYFLDSQSFSRRGKKRNMGGRKEIALLKFEHTTIYAEQSNWMRNAPQLAWRIDGGVRGRDG